MALKVLMNLQCFSGLCHGHDAWKRTAVRRAKQIP